MPLMSTKPMFDLAYDGGFAVGAFNVNNMEITQGIIDACAKEKSPLILQISKGARKYANIRYLKRIIDAAVEEHPELPIAIHCDHGDTLDLIQTCINDGYTSVMIDGSHHPYDENVKLTADAVKLAHANGVVVEAELGMLGGIEEDVVGLDAEEYEKNVEKFLTDPEQAKDFYKRTGIDSLAVAIGTSHGAYKFKHEAKLAFNRIEQIMKTCPGLPLVMHGSAASHRNSSTWSTSTAATCPTPRASPRTRSTWRSASTASARSTSTLTSAWPSPPRSARFSRPTPRNSIRAITSAPRATPSRKWFSASSTFSTAPARPTP